MFQEQLQPYFPAMFLSLYALGIAYYAWDAYKEITEDEGFIHGIMEQMVVAGGFTKHTAAAILALFAVIYVAAWPIFVAYRTGQSFRRAWLWRRRLKGAKKVGNIYYVKGVTPPESPKEKRKDR